MRGSCRWRSPTDAGRLPLAVAGIAAEPFDRLPARLAGPEAEIRGRIIATTVDEIADRLVAPIARFQARHPDTQVDVIADSRRLRRDDGEAHVSPRPGAPAARRRPSRTPWPDRSPIRTWRCTPRPTMWRARAGRPMTATWRAIASWG
ncbi:MAG: hypothetical protein AAF192_23675 [Pseudomonadota bacterium]